MQFSDLHIHSRYSDGILSPKEIIKISNEKGLKCISITDHDNVEAQAEAEEFSVGTDTTIIPGIELSTEYMEREIHILGYFINCKNISLINELEKIKKVRRDRALEIMKKLNQLNIDISYADINEDITCIGRPHIAKILVKKGYVSNVKEAFQQFLIKGKPAYVERYKINYKDVLKLICDCGGIAALAHPGEIYRGIALESLIKEFKVYGLRGLEVFHPSHSTAQVNSFYNIAKKYSMTITGGSDCHGMTSENGLLLGTCGLNEELINKFLRIKQIK